MEHPSLLDMPGNVHHAVFSLAEPTEGVRFASCSRQLHAVAASCRPFGARLDWLKLSKKLVRREVAAKAAKYMENCMNEGFGPPVEYVGGASYYLQAMKDDAMERHQQASGYTSA